MNYVGELSGSITPVCGFPEAQLCKKLHNNVDMQKKCIIRRVMQLFLHNSIMQFFYREKLHNLCYAILPSEQNAYLKIHKRVLLAIDDHGFSIGLSICRPVSAGMAALSTFAPPARNGDSCILGRPVAAPP